MALEGKELDANFFQHKPYLDDFNKEKGTRLVSVGAIHYEPFGIYAGKDQGAGPICRTARWSPCPTTPPTRRAPCSCCRTKGFIKLKDGAGLTATTPRHRGKSQEAQD